ncbi:MAG: DUF4271 domain-containing protein [Chitinophagaceae bacterium]
MRSNHWSGNNRAKNTDSHALVCLVLLFLAVFVPLLHLRAQQVDSVHRPAQTVHKKDTAKKAVPKKDTSKLKTSVGSTHTDTSVKKDSEQHRPLATSRTDSLAKKKTTTPPVAPIPHKDSANTAPRPHKAVKDTTKKETVVPRVIGKKADSLFEKTIAVPYLPLRAKPIYVIDTRHPYQSKDTLFFIVCGVFLLYGIVRTTFPDYTDKLFRNLVSFSSMDRNEYTIGQNNLPSLLLNLLFCLSAGLLGTLLIEQPQKLSFAFWQLWLLGSLAFAAIYLVKFLTIYLFGWIFDASDDANTYMYVVFLVNKIVGVLCLPAILVFAFADNPLLSQYIATLGSILLVVLLLYRYVVSFSVIARNLQLNAFHFFLYLCSVEIVPILILYKLFFKDLVHWL